MSKKHKVRGSKPVRVGSSGIPVSPLVLCLSFFLLDGQVLV